MTHHLLPNQEEFVDDVLGLLNSHDWPNVESIRELIRGLDDKFPNLTARDVAFRVEMHYTYEPHLGVVTEYDDDDYDDDDLL